MSSPNPLGGSGSGIHPGPGLEHQTSWESQSGAKAGLGVVGTEVEGEWSREGLGQGLEQRLEGLVQSKAA